MTGFLEQAQGYLRTAQAALDAGDLGPAFENARTAAELAGKHILSAFGRPPKQHNITEDLVKSGAWPAGEPARRLSKFLGAHTRGIYGFDEPVKRAEAERGYRLAEQLIARAHSSR